MVRAYYSPHSQNILPLAEVKVGKSCGKIQTGSKSSHNVKILAKNTNAIKKNKANEVYGYDW
jgi:hypothetical protein